MQRNCNNYYYKFIIGGAILAGLYANTSTWLYFFYNYNNN
ncbi:hypothetical protein ABIB50_004789 [Mucilaginibacter sp. UYCu711]